MASDGDSGRKELDLSNIPGHYPNIPPYPVINPAPTWFQALGAMKGSDYATIAGATAFMFAAGALGGASTRVPNWRAAQGEGELPLGRMVGL